MHTTLPDHDTAAAESIRAPVGKQSRRISIALAILIGCVALSMTGFAIIIPVFPQRLQELGLGAETLALMEGSFGLGMFLFSTPMGIWAGRIGRKPILFIALAGFIATNLALIFVNNAVLFIGIRFIEGMFIAGLLPAAMAMVGDTIPSEKQGRWIGFITTAEAMGIALGPGLGGLLYDNLGFASPFLFSAGIALVGSFLVFLLVPETLPESVRIAARERKTNREAKSEKPAEMRFSRLIVLFAPLLIIDFGLLFAYPFVMPQYPFFFEEVLHYSASQYGLIISAFGLSMGIFPLILGRLSETLPKKPMIVTGTLLFGVLNLAVLVTPSYPLLILGAVLTGLGSAIAMPIMGTLYLGSTTDANRGQVMGMRGSAFSLAVMVGPLLQAVIAPWVTPPITFAIGVFISLGITVVAFFLLKSPEKNVENQTTA